MRPNAPLFRRRRPWAALVACVFGLCAGAAVRTADVIVPGSTDFPESMTAASDGTLFFSSMAGGRIFRAAPGETTASEWIKPGTNGLNSVLGVLADEKSNTLYACSLDLSAWGIPAPSGKLPDSLKLFDLKSGAPKGSVAMPVPEGEGKTSLCNDIAVGTDGTAYVTDTMAGHVLRLKPNATAFEIWAQDPRWVGKGQLDGIAVLDGNVYANIWDGDGLYRIAINVDGSAGTITKLATSRPLYHSDGLRAAGHNTLLMVEGFTKGTLDRIKLDGDKAQVETIRGGFQVPVSLVQVGDTVYLLDSNLPYLFDEKLKGQQPPPFTAFAIKLPQ